MDIIGLAAALVKFFQDNYLVILDFVNRAGQLVVDGYALLLLLAAIWEKYTGSERASALKKTLTAPFKK
jgi:hypothetical protein